MLFDELTEVLDPEPHGAALNMAIDEVLLCSADEPLLRVYRWTKPAISFGYFTKYSELGSVASGWEPVRRWTGGGVVPHGEDVTYTLIVPAGHAFSRLPAPESYRRIHGCIAEVLRGAGLETTLAAATAEKVSAGCFENPAEADVLAGEQKVAGAAQRRTRWGLLHQGSIQTPVGAIARRLGPSFADEVSQRPLGDDEVAAALLLAQEKYASDSWLHRF